LDDDDEERKVALLKNSLNDDANQDALMVIDAIIYAE